MNRAVTPRPPGDRARPGATGPARHPIGPPGARAVLGLQRAAGNRAVAAHLARPPLTVQRKLGFELEMLALVDDNGGPAPVKQPFGTVGNLTLDVDRSNQVETSTPANPAEQYDSIVELVTPAYPAETPEGAAQLVGDIATARQFAEGLTLDQRVPASTLPGIATNERGASYHVGNPNQPNQTTAASIQSTLGIRLSQLGPLFDALVAERTFLTKHPSDRMPGSSAKQKMAEARRAGRSIVADSSLQEHFGEVLAANYPDADLQRVLGDLGGLLTLALQYVLLGQQYEDSGTGKNIVTVLSRTDLAHIFAPLWQTYDRLFDDHVRDQLIGLLQDKAGIEGTAPLFAGNPAAITVERFLRNVFYEGSDGLTSSFDGFKRMDQEVVDPGTNELGPVLEVRNIARPDWSSDRFPPALWPGLANWFARTVAALNTAPGHGDYSAPPAQEPAPEEPIEELPVEPVVVPLARAPRERPAGSGPRQLPVGPANRPERSTSTIEEMQERQRQLRPTHTVVTHLGGLYKPPS